MFGFSLMFSMNSVTKIMLSKFDWDMFAILILFSRVAYNFLLK